ncbi:MAG TPA: DUF1552 domain-containing protein [Bdellovibrionales bacterium]|nr:DUF1552 domain-containing protein [Bdellovibrionales bacterium]
MFAIPFLPSLAEKAYAQTPAKNLKRFVTFYWSGGGGAPIWFPNVPASLMTTTGTNYKAMRLTDVLTRNGRISDAFRDPRFAKYAPMLNIYRGMDIERFTGHNKLGALAGESDGDRSVDSLPQYPSIDYLISRSPAVYPTEPASRLGVLGVMDSTNNWNGPSISFSKTSSGTTSVIPPILSPIAAYDYYFKDFVPSGPAGDAALAALKARRKSVLDTVFEDYKRTMASTRLASSEKSVLSSHVEQFRELEKKIDNIKASACASVPTRPTTSLFLNTPDMVAMGYFKNQRDLLPAIDLMIEISATAMRCQMTNVVTIMLDAGNCGFNYMGIGDTHGLSHGRVSPDPTNRANAMKQTADMNNLYIGRILNFMDKIDIDDPAAAGERMLDNTLILGTNEFGSVGNHRSWSLPVFTLGGGNRVNTGWYVDYRGKRAISDNYSDREIDLANLPVEYFGRDYNSLLIGCMTAMGLTPADWEKPGVAGFGSYQFPALDKGWYVESETSPAGIITPGRRTPPPFFLKA